MNDHPADRSAWVRLPFRLGPWQSPEEPDWVAAYEAWVDALVYQGLTIYGVLEDGLGTTPLDDHLARPDGQKAKAWTADWVANAASVVHRFADRVAAFEALPAPNLPGPHGSRVHPAAFARLLNHFSATLSDLASGPGSAVPYDLATPRVIAARPDLVAGALVANAGAVKYARRVAAAGGWKVDAAWGADAERDGAEARAGRSRRAWAVQMVLTKSGVARAARLIRLWQPGDSHRPAVYVSGYFAAEGEAQVEPEWAMDRLHAALGNAVELRQVGDESWDARPAVVAFDPRMGATGGPETSPAIFVPEGVTSAESAASPESVTVADGFDFPVGPRGGSVWETHKIDAFVADPGYFVRFRAWHTGEDWNGRGGGDSDLGDPIYAVASGEVVAAKYFPVSWGNIVLVMHQLPDGSQVWSQYAHLDAMLVRAGDRVERGQQLGTMGKGAAGRWVCHLHFELRLTDLPPDNWQPMVANKASVQANYAEAKEFIEARRPGTLDQPVGEPVIVDQNTRDPAVGSFTRVPEANWFDTAAGLNGGAIYTFASRHEENVGTWRARLPQPASYLVAVFVPDRDATTRNAVYTVRHAGGEAMVRVNQARVSNAWVTLGRFDFAAEGEVWLSDKTGESGALRRRVGFDAVRWLQVG